MAPPKGNQFWMARSSHGRHKLFKSSELLWEACVEYFQWVEDNPLTEEKIFCSQGEISRGEVDKMRAMTIDGLCLFLDIDDSTWQTWRKDDDFNGVVGKADKVIRSQKFTGASAGLLNANIIARDLGLVDKVNNDHTGGLTIVSMDSTDEAL